MNNSDRNCARSLVNLILVLLFSAPGWGKQAPTVQQLLESARKASDVSKLEPYTLSADVVLNPADKKHSRSGTLIIYRDAERNRVDLQLGNYRETRIAVPGSLYIVPGQSMMFLTELHKLEEKWRSLPYANDPKTHYSRVSNKKIHGERVWCVDQSAKQYNRTLCFDAVSFALVSDFWKSDALGVTHEDQTEYSSFTTLNGVLYPQEIAVKLHDIVPLQIRNLRIVPGTVPADEFVPTPEMTRIETCRNETPPQAVFTPDPKFPEKSRANAQTSDALAHLLISNQGKVVMVQVAGPGEGFDTKVVDAVKQWRFKPAHCGDHDVDFEFLVDIDVPFYSSSR